MAKDSKTEKRCPLPAALLALGLALATSAADAATVRYVWRSPSTGKIINQVVDVGTSTSTPTTPTPASPDTTETTLSVAYDIPAIIALGSTVSLVPTVKSSGGSIHYSIGGSPLPPALSINASTGVISGKTYIAGTYTFDILVTDPSAPFGAFTTLTLNIE